MPYTLTIHNATGVKKIVVPEGTQLLHTLNENAISISAPCGGHGTCGKCQVEITDNHKAESKKQKVLACQFVVKSDLEVFISEPEEVKIQSESYFPDLNIKYNSIEGPDYGIAVDIGTTTVVVFLEDLSSRQNLATASFLNPQKAFGADVISRIQYATEPEGLKKLQEVLTTELDSTIHRLIQEKGIDATTISKISMAGNTTMLHLLKRVDPSSLATYPFNPVFIDHQSFPASELELKSIPNATVHLLPSLSAYVGADIMAGISASELPDEDDYALFLDIGTNGEMALGNKNQILCCATAAGPAFEGAKISCGLGGVKGAIHRFSDEGFETIGNTDPVGLCGSGLIDVVAHLLKTHQIDPSGYIENPIKFLPESDLSLTPQDIREVQLAKGAIAAGIHTLIQKAEIQTSQISKVYLAGGFGYAIHTESAIDIGLFPEELVTKIIRAGNTAGLGARLFLHSEDFVERIKRIAATAGHFDLSTDMGFNESFVMNMGFPD